MISFGYYLIQKFVIVFFFQINKLLRTSKSL